MSEQPARQSVADRLRAMANLREATHGPGKPRGPMPTLPPYSPTPDWQPTPHGGSETAGDQRQEPQEQGRLPAAGAAALLPRPAGGAPAPAVAQRRPELQRLMEQLQAAVDYYEARRPPNRPAGPLPSFVGLPPQPRWLPMSNYDDMSNDEELMEPAATGKLQCPSGAAASCSGNGGAIGSDGEGARGAGGGGASGSASQQEI